MENTEENSERKWKIWKKIVKRFGKYRRNSEKIGQRRGGREKEEGGRRSGGGGGGGGGDLFGCN